MIVPPFIVKADSMALAALAPLVLTASTSTPLEVWIWSPAVPLESSPPSMVRAALSTRTDAANWFTIVVFVMVPPLIVADAPSRT